MQNLGKAWSGLLAHTDAELGIDSEYTRPGIEALLRRFTESVNSTLEQVDCAPFEWDSYKTAPAVSGAKGKKRKAAGEAPV